MSERTIPKLDAADMARAVRAWRPGLWRSLAATAAEAFSSYTTLGMILNQPASPLADLPGEQAEPAAVSPGQRLAAERDRRLAELDQQDRMALGVARPPVTGITREQHAAMVEGRPLPYDPWDTPERLRERIDGYDARQVRRWLIEQRRAGLLESAAQFVVGLGATAPDPVNFVPWIGPEMRAAMLARAGGNSVARLGVRVGIGATEATVGNLLVEPAITASELYRGDDVTASMIVLDLVLGAGVGGAFGGVSHVLAERAARRAARALPPRPQPPVQEPGPQLGDVQAPVPVELPAVEVDPAVDLAEALISDPLRRVGGQGARFAGELPGRAMPWRVSAAAEHGLLLDTAVEAVRREASVSIGAPARQTWALPSTAVRPDGVEHPVEWRVVEAADLIASHNDELVPNPAFPQELQPRQRDRAASAAQIARIASDLRPELLGPSVTVTDGAPIVGPDLVVEAGNGRVLGLRRAYRLHPDRADAYRRYIESLGFDVRGMREPVLVRVRTDELDMPDRAVLARKSNERTTAAMSDAERALVDAKALDDDLLALLETESLEGPKAAPFVRRFLEQVASEGDLPELVTRDKKISRRGISRIRAALLARAYGDANLVERLLDDPDETLGAIGRALFEAAAPIARLRSAIEAGRISPTVDAIDDLVAGVRALVQAKDAGDPLDAPLAQRGLTDDFELSLESKAWVRALLKRDRKGRLRLRSQTEVTAMLREYARLAAQQAPEPDMFGGEPMPALHVMAAAGVLDPQPGMPFRVVEFDRETWSVLDDRLRRLQPADDLDVVYQLAPKRQAELERAGREIADELGLGVEFITPGLKQKETAAGKMRRRKVTSARKLTDIVRAGFVVDDVQQAEEVIARLAAKLAVVDEGLMTSPVGYADRRLTVRFADGLIGEVQILQREMAAAKKIGYKWYSEARNLPLDDPRRQELEAKQRDLYEKAVAFSPSFFASELIPPKRAISRRNSESQAVRFISGPASSDISASAGSMSTQSSSLANKARTQVPSTLRSRTTGLLSSEPNSSRSSDISDALLLGGTLEISPTAGRSKGWTAPEVWRPVSDLAVAEDPDWWRPIADRLRRPADDEAIVRDRPTPTGLRPEIAQEFRAAGVAEEEAQGAAHLWSAMIDAVAEVLDRPASALWQIREGMRQVVADRDAAAILRLAEDSDPQQFVRAVTTRWLGLLRALELAEADGGLLERLRTAFGLAADSTPDAARIAGAFQAWQRGGAVPHPAALPAFEALQRTLEATYRATMEMGASPSPEVHAFVRHATASVPPPAERSTDDLEAIYRRLLDDGRVHPDDAAEVYQAARDAETLEAMADGWHAGATCVTRAL